MPEANEDPAEFSRQEIKKVRDSLGARDARPRCPRCDGLLTTSNPADGPGGPLLIVGCRHCRCRGVVTDVPGMWKRGPKG